MQEVVGSIPIGSTIFLARQADPPRSAYPAFLHANAWRGLQQEVVGSIPIGSTIFHGTGTALGAVPCGGTAARRHSGTDREAGAQRHRGTGAQGHGQGSRCTAAQGHGRDKGKIGHDVVVPLPEAAG